MFRYGEFLVKMILEGSRFKSLLVQLSPYLVKSLDPVHHLESQSVLIKKKLNPLSLGSCWMWFKNNLRVVLVMVM